MMSSKYASCRGRIIDGTTPSKLVEAPLVEPERDKMTLNQIFTNQGEIIYLKTKNLHKKMRATTHHADGIID